MSVVSLQAQGWNHGSEGGVPDRRFPGDTGAEPPPRVPLYLVHSGNSTRCVDSKAWIRVECRHGGVKWVLMRCRACSGCLSAKKGMMTAKVLSGLLAPRWVSLVTLTSMPSMTWPGIMRAFSALVRWMRRQLGPLEYACIKEEGANTGMKHLHVLVTGVPWVPYTLLSRAWQRLTSAWNVDVRRVWGGRLAAYVAKYVGKALEIRKMVTFSRGFKPPWLKVEGLRVTVDAREPLQAAWIVPEDDGALIEVECQECHIGPKKERSDEYISREGPVTCQGT